MKRGDSVDPARLDDAARAGWLYYVARNTQDEIARKLGVSRQSAQRLVSLAVSEGLVKVSLDHPIGRCMELGRDLSARFSLSVCEVVPSDPEAPDLLAGIAIAGAAEISRALSSTEPKIIALGTGRALRAAIEDVPRMECPQHRIVSLVGNMMQDGSATPYNATIRLAEKARAPHYPMPLPVLATDAAERAVLHAQAPVRNTLDLCRRADVAFVGLGGIDDAAPLVVDGFVSRDEMAALRDVGGVGEITGWVFDAEGRQVPDIIGDRVTSAPLFGQNDRLLIAVASGAAKVPGLRAALRGRLIGGLITNEATASALISGEK